MEYCDAECDRERGGGGLSWYDTLSKENSRLSKADIVALEDWHKTASLEQKEQRALTFIEQAIEKVRNDHGDDAKIVVSCSFGIDSIVTLHLVRRVADNLGVTFDTVWNNTLNEYPQTRKYGAELTEAWGLRLIEARPEKTLTKVYEENGVESLIKRKGDRSKGKPVIEKCCHHLKHQPMRKAIREHGWHLMFNGVRTGESRQRWMSARRDGEFYYSRSEWKTWVARPILWWSSLSDSFNYGNNRQEDVWNYVKKYAIPYNPIYDMNAVIDDKYSGNALVVDRETAQELVAQGYNVFMPRTGCQACPIPIRRGYLRYLRQVFPRVFRAMLFQLGFARVLLAEMDERDRQSLIEEMSFFGVIDDSTRAFVIKRASEDVQTLSDRIGSIEFVVNRWKRTVAALIRTEGEIIARGKAKTHPDDQFDEHIGKAIAVRRALNLEIPTEYIDMPRNTEDAIIDRLEKVLELRPCAFDGVGVDKRKRGEAA